jgi:hypothetical protein
MLILIQKHLCTMERLDKGHLNPRKQVNFPWPGSNQRTDETASELKSRGTNEKVGGSGRWQMIFIGFGPR